MAGLCEAFGLGLGEAFEVVPGRSLRSTDAERDDERQVA